LSRAVKWIIAVFAGAVAFPLTWWVCEQFHVPRDTTIGIAGTAAGLVLAPLGYWAGKDGPGESESGKSIGQATGAAVGALIVRGRSTINVQSSARMAGAGDRPSQAQPDPPFYPDVELDELPVTLTSQMIGRDDQLGTLRQFLLQDDVTVVTVTGFGGAGKSTLVEALLAGLAPDYQGARKIFGWHFYSQEERGTEVTNASMFWDRALRFFQFTGEMPLYETEKAHELLKALHEQKSILVLDGIESLQNAPNVNRGILNDRALRGFITSIARDGLRNGGLVILTSRQQVTELGPFRRARNMRLANLDAASGAALLRAYGVRGAAADLEAAAADFGGHPLSLVLLARILATDYGGDIIRRHGFEIADDPAEDNVRSVLDYYTRLFGETDPELIYLYLISLVRRPMRTAELAELADKSLLGRALTQFPEARRARALSTLRAYGLILTERDSYDTHALIRSYFCTQFQRRRPGEFIQAHSVLFEYFAGLPADELPADLETMAPLYRAVYHGCAAGRHAGALEIYWHRICRERRFYSQKELGAFSSDLAAIVPFFSDGWGRPVVSDLSEERRAWLLAVAAFLLTALGRLEEAVQPRQTEIAIFDELQDRHMTCSDHINLVQTLIPLGRLADANRASQRAAQISKDLDTPQGQFSAGMEPRYLRVSALVREAAVRHRRGDLAAAGELFQSAEDLYETPLTRANGFYYGLYLLETLRTQEDARALLTRGEANLETAVRSGRLADIGSSHLVSGAAAAALGESDNALSHLDRAVDMLRRANRVDRQPLALLVRARYYRERWLRTGEEASLRSCEADLAELRAQAEFSRMRLFTIDGNLLQTELYIDQAATTQASELLASTVADIRETGYELRSPEVTRLQTLLTS
jgi:hypothetical protein